MTVKIIDINTTLLEDKTADDVIDDLMYDPEDVWLENCIEITNEDQFGKDMIIAPSVAYRLIADNLIVVEGEYCNYEEDTDTYEPDWSVTLVYENVENDNDFDPNKWLYMEQGTVSSTVHNFKHYMND